MSGLSTTMAASALRMLTRLGEPVSFSQTVVGTYDPDTESTGAGTTTVYTGYAAPINYDNTEIDGTLVERGDLRLIVNKTSAQPRVEDTVTFRSEDYRIIDVRYISVSGVNVAYEIQIRA